MCQLMQLSLEWICHRQGNAASRIIVCREVPMQPMAGTAISQVAAGNTFSQKAKSLVSVRENQHNQHYPATEGKSTATLRDSVHLVPYEMCKTEKST